MSEDRWHWCFGGAPFGPTLWSDESLLFGSAVLSRWSIDDHLHHLLPTLDDDDPFVGSVPWELLQVRTAGLDVFVCHLAPAPRHGDHRRAQVLAIDEIISSVRGDLDAVLPPGQTREGMPAILCGDFNAEPDSDEIRFLCSFCVLDGRTKFFQDAWRVAGDGAGYTQDWRANPIAASTNINRKRIDYVVIGDPYQRRRRAGRVLGAELAFHESLTGVHASDHAGVVVRVVWPQRPR